MTNHNNIYNILAKLKSVEPVQEPAPKKQESVLKTLNEHSTSIVKRLNDQYQQHKQLNEYFHFDIKPGKDRGPRDTGTDELERRSKLGKNPLVKHGKEYKEKDKYGDAYNIGGPKGHLPEGEVDEEVLIAKKDFDGDGKKESPKDEYMGSRDKAIKKAMSGSGEKADEGNKFTGNLAKARAAGKDEADLDGDGDMEKVHEGEYDDSVNKSKIPAYQRKAKGDDDWKVTQQDLDHEAEKNISHSKNIARRSGKQVDEAFPTVDDARKRAEQEKGTGKFDKQTTSTGTRYTRKSDTYSDDDSEETSSSDTPKKRGRPKKNTGPERVTSKAWKHKGGRKLKEYLNIETVVEDTMQELDDLLIMEKSVSKAQQRFMGMVYAAKKGDKPASKEVAKAASGMSKKDARDFAKTKHKGLPNRVDESISPANPALDSICHRYGKECKDFMTSGMMDPDLYHALHDHYYDEMPAAVKRGDNTKEWVEDQFHSDMGGMDFDGGDDSLSTLPVSIKLGRDHELDELAKLAGLNKDPLGESGCNMTAEGEYCPEHGMMECGMGMMYEADEKADKDYDGDGEVESDKDEVWGSRAKAAASSGKPFKEELEECGVPMSSGGMDDQDSGMSVSTSVDTRTGRKTININADGETAEQIAQILKMAGLAAHNEVHGDEHQGHMHMHAEQPQVIAVAEEWANKAEVDYEDVDAITDQGGDLNKKKKQDPHTANKAANPLKEGENEVINRLQAMYSRFKRG